MSNNNVFDRARGYGAQGLKAGINVLGGFQQFILRGNVIDLAVGIVIGAAFTTVINGAVSDLLQPLIGRFVGTTNFDSFAPGGFKIGHLFGVLVTFLLTAAVVYFFVVLPYTSFRNRFLPAKEEEKPAIRECPFCLSTVPLKATRCAYCTAQLPPVEDTEAARG